MSVSTENIPSYAKWPTAGIIVGGSVALGAAGINRFAAEKVVHSPRTAGLKTGALATLLIFDALAIKDMPLPGDRNASAMVGAGAGAVMLGGTAGAAKWLFTSKDSLDIYAKEGQNLAKLQSAGLKRAVGVAALTAMSFGIAGGAIAGAIYAGKEGAS